MKRAEYKLPFGEDGSLYAEHLGPRIVGHEPAKKGKNGETIEGKPIYEYVVITTPESENLDELRSQVDGQSDENVRTLGQGALDIIRQRKIREFAQSDEVEGLLAGKDDRTAHMHLSERITFVRELIQQVGDEYVYGARQASTTGATTKAAKEALAQKQLLAKAAAENPAVARKLEQLQKQLAELGAEYASIIPGGASQAA